MHTPTSFALLKGALVGFRVHYSILVRRMQVLHQKRLCSIMPRAYVRDVIAKGEL